MEHVEVDEREGHSRQAVTKRVGASYNIKYTLIEKQLLNSLNLCNNLVCYNLLQHKLTLRKSGTHARNTGQNNGQI